MTYEDVPGCKTEDSGLKNWRVQFSRIRLESEYRFSLYLVKILRSVQNTMSNCLYICKLQPIVKETRQQSINRYFINF
jgi:hypothetical protein